MLAACGGGGGSSPTPLAGTTGTTGTSGTAGTTGTGGTSGATGTTESSGATAGSGQPQSGQPPAPAIGTGQGSASSPSPSSSPSAAPPADATQARFNHPLGIARDSSGNLYVADSANHTIRKISPAGVVTTLAGTAGSSGSSDGAGGTGRFSALRGIAVDGAGNVYAVDNSAIRKITPAGVVSTLAGIPGQLGDADGTGRAARFRRPWGIAADGAGNVYVADTENSLVRRITPAGVVSTFAGTRGMRGRADGSTASATFLSPMGIAIDAGGNLYLTDWYGPPAPNIPEGSTFIRRIASDGSVSTMAGTMNSDTTPGAFMDTFAITTDGSGNVFVAAMRSVRRISSTGTIATVAGPSSRFQSLEGITIDGAGDLYVTDFSSHTVSRVTQAGAITLVAGKAEEPGSTNAP